MGHKSPDMDSLGAAIGVLNIAKSNSVEGHIVFDPDDVNTGIYRVVEAMKKDDEIWQHFIGPDNGGDLNSHRSRGGGGYTYTISGGYYRALITCSEYRIN